MTVEGTRTFDDGALEDSIAADDAPLGDFRLALKAGAEALERQFHAGTPVDKLVTGRAHQVDQILRRVWRRQFTAHPATAALVAVGGYGRGELHPHSDIDIMILLVDEDREPLRGAIEGFLVFLWDMGLVVGQSVRTVEDCRREAEADITVATNLIESRLIAGPQTLFDAMREATGPDRIWPSDRFFEAKWREQQARHHKFHDTAYNLEPNIKEGPGGLRDIQMIGWVAKRHFDARTLHDLVEHGFLTDSEYLSLLDGQNFLWHVRFALHSMTGRREDRLLFDYQRSLAEQMGYRDGEANLAVEQLMQRYYRTIQELRRLNEMLLQLFQEAILYADDSGEPISINKRFRSRKGFLEATSPQVFTRYPFALLELFLVMEQHPELKGVRAWTIRLVRDHTYLIDDKFRADVRARSLFMEILRQPIGVTHELRRMNRYGVLAAYVLPFAQIVGRMQYDLFHTYTVDEHTLFVVRNLRRFTVPEYHHEFPLCSDIIGQIPKPELLYLAGFFHDIAKGRGGDHSELGARDAIAFALHHGLSHFDARLVGWLVRNHLIMSMTAQRKDISDPEVIAEFAGIAGDQMHLDYLYLLTVADIRATNPNLWNSWRDALLRELYGATKRALRRGLEQPIDADDRIEEVQTEARTLLRAQGLAEEVIDRLWSNPSTDYFLRHTPEEIAWHTAAIAKARADDLPLVLVQGNQRGSTAVFVYGPVHAHQFAVTTAVLEQLGITIVDARIITSTNGYTLDTFQVLEETGERIENEFRLQEIRDTLKRHLAHPERFDLSVSRRRARQLRHFDIPTEVHFQEDAHNDRTIVEVVTADRPGVLSRIGRAFMHCNVILENARIATIGARTEDVFYLTGADGKALRRDQDFECLRRAITEMLNQ